MKRFICTKTEPVVQTKAGKLRGFYLDGVYNFRGVQYGVADRFMPPRDVAPWDGIKDAIKWGFTAPTPTPGGVGDDFTVPHRWWPQDEDCLYLNVWSNSLDPSAKKPVLFWIHGGGFYNGSSMEMIAYDGDELARHKDVVLVTVNHRLNVLGYFDLSEFGERYHNSGNAGMEDLVQALKWVKENIAQFGGDPDNVTIFGQSGGGGKVTTLMQTPAADGLFHKAIIQSGVGMGHRGEKRDDAGFARKMMSFLGVDDIAALETVPLEDLMSAYRASCDKSTGNPLGMLRGGATGPVANDWYLGDPMVVGFTEHAKTIPTICGSVCAEGGYSGKLDLPNRDEMTDEEVRAAVADEFGAENADAIIKAFKAAYPTLSPVYALFLSNRSGVVEWCKKKAAVSSAPVFNYNFALVFDFDGGIPAWHCAEIPFVFHTAERLSLYCMDGVMETVQEVMSSAWTNFAKTGNPSGGAVGEWPATAGDAITTYVVAEHSDAKVEFDTEICDLIGKYKKSRGMF